MLSKFWEDLGSGLAERGLTYLFSPAFIFFGGGAALYVWSKGWRATLKAVVAWGAEVQAIAVIVAVLVIVLAALVVRAFRFAVVRLLEGYWPWPFNHLGNAIARRRSKRLQARLARLRALHKQALTGELTPAERAEQVRLELWLHNHPANPDDLLPTALGNILRARERAPERKYGLEAVICWPRLWLLLPDRAREDLAAARETLFRRAELVLWGLLFLAWTPFSAWAILIGLVWAFVGYNLALQAAQSFGDLLESTFGLYRHLLYEAVGWEKPADLAAERAAGKQLSAFLWRGTIPGSPPPPTEH